MSLFSTILLAHFSPGARIDRGAGTGGQNEGAAAKPNAAKVSSVRVSYDICHWIPVTFVLYI